MLALILAFFSLLSFAEFRPLDPELKDYPYPFPVQVLKVKYKDQTFDMAYMDITPPGKIKGEVILLHGKNFSGNYWERTAKDLFKKGYRVLIPDQIGFGKSSKPVDFQYSFQALASFTHELVLEKKFSHYILIGHSMGGMLATRYALMYPKEVKKLLLINPIGLEDWKTKVPYRTVTENYQAELQSNEDKIRNYQKESYFDGKWKPEYDKQIEIAVGQTLHKDYPRVAWNSALASDMVFTQPVVYEFKNLQVPTLLLLGTRDRTALGKAQATPEVRAELGRYDKLGKTVIKLIPQGQLVELPGIGHMPQVEDYETYWQNIVKFIEK